jgi:hypothetical protein
MHMATTLPAAPPRANEPAYWTSSPSTFCRATHAHGNGSVQRAAARQ